MVKTLEKIVFDKLEIIIEDYNNSLWEYYGMDEDGFRKWYDNLMYIKEFEFISMTDINFEELENPFIHSENITSSDIEREIINYIEDNNIKTIEDIEDIDLDELLDYIYMEITGDYYINAILNFYLNDQIVEDYTYELFNGYFGQNRDILDTDKTQDLAYICSILEDNSLEYIEQYKNDILQWVNGDIIILENMEVYINEDILFVIAKRYFENYKDKIKLRVLVNNFVDTEDYITFEDIEEDKYIDLYYYDKNANGLFETWLFDKL